MFKQNKYWFRVFMTEDDGGGGGGGGGEPQVQEPPTTTATLDPSAFAKEFGNVIAEQFKQNAPVQQKAAPTPEELAAYRKQLNYWEPDDSFVQEFGNLETQKGAFGKLRDGLTNQMVTIMKVALAEQQQQFEQRLTPLQQVLQERQSAEIMKSFNESYPVLAKPELKPLIDSIGASLHQQGKFKGMSQSQAFAELAKGVEAVIKQVHPEFSVSSSTPTNPGRSSNSIPSTSFGSGGGGSNAGNGGGKLPVMAQILGNPKPGK